MGKKQHQKDKFKHQRKLMKPYKKRTINLEEQSKYITNKEWKEEWGGKKDDVLKAKFRRLPFNYCSISLQPFENPLCTKEGVIFDIMNIVPFLKKFKKSPVTGEPMTAKDLIKLKFYKNANGQYHCPVTYKIFNENSNIVAIKTTGNVFAYEAVDELNLKSKNFKDLLTSELFTRKDIITLQDPSKLEKFNISNFYHIKHNLKVLDEDEESAKKDPRYRIRKANLETESTLNELEKSYKNPTESYLKGSGDASKTEEGKYLAHYSTGAVSGSFTSTAQERSNTQQAATLEDDIVRYDRVKKLGKKGYVQLKTSHGNINLELHCDMVQKACENFIKLCAKEYYNDTIFHRLIKHFMVQGGDPTGTGSGGESFWGEKFKDEFKPNLSHSGRGILSMANSGKNTNGSQFFITFRSCQHLDNKHTIFGRVVGGLDTLTSIESVKTDDNDKPVDTIRLISTTVFVNPYDEVDEQLKKEEEEKKLEQERQKGKLQQEEKKEKKLKVYRSGEIGKYIPTNISKRLNEGITEEENKVESKKKKISGFGDFSSW